MFQYKNIYLTIGGTPFSTPFGCGRAQRGRAGYGDCHGTRQSLPNGLPWHGHHCRSLAGAMPRARDKDSHRSPCRGHATYLVLKDARFAAESCTYSRFVAAGNCAYRPGGILYVVAALSHQLTFCHGDSSRDQSHESPRRIVSPSARRDVPDDAGALGPLLPAARAIDRPVARPECALDQGGQRLGPEPGDRRCVPHERLVLL